MQFVDTELKFKEKKYIFNKRDGVFFSFNQRICFFDIAEKNFYYIKSNQYYNYKELNAVLKNVDFYANIYGNSSFVGFYFNEKPCLFFNQNIYIIDFSNMSYTSIKIEEAINHSSDYNFQAINCHEGIVYYVTGDNIVSMDLLANKKNIWKLEYISNFYIVDNSLYYLKRYNDSIMLVEANLENKAVVCLFDILSFIPNFDEEATFVVKEDEVYCVSPNSKFLLKIDIMQKKIIVLKEFSEIFEGTIIVADNELYLLKYKDEELEVSLVYIYEHGFIYELKNQNNDTYVKGEDRLTLQENNKYKNYYTKDKSEAYILKTHNLLTSNGDYISTDISDKCTPCLEYEYNGVKVHSFTYNGKAYLSIDYKTVAELRYAIDCVIGSYNEYLYFIPKDFFYYSYNLNIVQKKIQRINILTKNIETVDNSEVEYMTSYKGSNRWYCDRRGYAYLICAFDVENLKQVGLIDENNKINYSEMLKTYKNYSLTLCLDMKENKLYKGSPTCEDGNSLLKAYDKSDEYYEFSKNSKIENVICMYKNNLYYIETNSKKNKLYLYEFNMDNFTTVLAPTCNIYEVKFDGSVCIIDIHKFDNYYDCKTDEENLIICLWDITYVNKKDEDYKYGKYYGCLKKEGENFVFETS